MGLIRSIYFRKITTEMSNLCKFNRPRIKCIRDYNKFAKKNLFQPKFFIDKVKPKIVFNRSLFNDNNDFKVKNDRDSGHFYVYVGDAKAYVHYELKGKNIRLIHTYVPESARGKDVGKLLAKETFDFIKKNNLKAKVECEFLKEYMVNNVPDFGKFYIE